MAVAGRVLDAACAGHIVTELLGPDATPAEMTDWLTQLRKRVRGSGTDPDGFSSPHPPAP